MWKWLAVIAVAACLLWVLAPSRTPVQVQDANVQEIRFMQPGGPVAGPFDAVVRAFEKKSEEEHGKDPRQPVYRIVSGQDAQYDQNADTTRLLISIAGGMPPDVIYFARYATAEWAGRGAFFCMEDYLAQDLKNGIPDAIRKDDFYPNCWEEGTYDGKMYAIPNGFDNRALLYNKDLLKRAGLVDPVTGDAKPPRTWEELREYGKKLTQRDDAGNLKVIGFAPNYGNSWLYMFGWLAGGEFMSKDGKTCTLNDPGVVRGLQFMVDCYKDLGGYKAVQAVQTGFQGGEMDPFIQGQIAMQITGNWMMLYYAQFGRDLDFGVAPNPIPADRLAAGEKPLSWGGGWSYAIPVNAHHKEGAWKFIRFAVSNEAQKLAVETQREDMEAIGRVFIPSLTPKPALNKVLMARYVDANPQLNQRIKDGLKVFQDLIPVSRFRPVTPVGQLLWNHHVFAMEEACYGRKTPKQALDYATSVVQRDLDRFYAPRVGVQIDLRWFFAAYIALLVGCVYSVYRWDTSAGFRSGLVHLFRRSKAVGEGDLVEGARGGYFRQQWLGGFLCALPWIIGFAVFGGGPLLYSVVMSFCDYDVLGPPRFIGLKNFHVLFLEDELVPKAFGNTIYMLLGLPIGLAASLSVALLLNMQIRGMRLYRTLFYLPTIVPAVATCMLWLWIFHPMSGPLNSILKELGLKPVNWLQEEGWAKPSIILMGLWGVGGGMVIWLAGLRNISVQLYEAASLDGANAWQSFRAITLPQLSPYIFFNLIMGLIHTLQVFDQAFIMTHGGPVNATLFYVYHLFNNAFRYGHMGYACAMAWVLFVVILFFTILQMRLARRWVYYEHD